MADGYAKERLAGYLDEYVYRPILSRTPDDFEPSYRAMLAEVQRDLRRQLSLLHGSATPEEVVERFTAMTRAADADDTHRKMKELGLLPLPAPALEGFEEIARTLGVTTLR